MDWSEYTVRAVVADYEELGAYEASAAGGGLTAFLGGGSGRVKVHLKVLRLARVALLVQPLPGNSVELVWEPTLAFSSFDGMLCRYHEGPRGEPWRHWYCSRMAVTRDGYCSVHRNSWKALYERCAQGIDSACIEASRLVGGEKFSVYVLSYGGSRVKVGLTQDWRLLWRIAEQPHVVAARVFTGGLLESRELERRLGRHRLATEGLHVRVEERLKLAISTLERALAGGKGFEGLARSIAAALASLGLEGEYEAYTILPKSLGWLLRVRQTRSLEELKGKRLKVVDYWAGRLLVEVEGGEKLAVPKHILQHYMLKGVEG